MGGGFKELALENIELIGNRATHHRAKRKKELHCDFGAFLTCHLSFCLFFSLISYLTLFSLTRSVVLRVARLCFTIDGQTRYNHQHLCQSSTYHTSKLMRCGSSLSSQATSLSSSSSLLHLQFHLHLHLHLRNPGSNLSKPSPKPIPKLPLKTLPETHTQTSSLPPTRA